MSLKTVLEDPATWLPLVGTAIAGLLGWKMKEASTKKTNEETHSMHIDTAIKVDTYNEEKWIRINKRVDEIMQERDVLKKANAELVEKYRALEIKVDELVAELNLYKTIHA